MRSRLANIRQAAHRPAPPRRVVPTPSRGPRQPSVATGSPAASRTVRPRADALRALRLDPTGRRRLPRTGRGTPIHNRQTSTQHPSYLTGPFHIRRPLCLPRTRWSARHRTETPHQTRERPSSDLQSTVDTQKAPNGEKLQARALITGAPPGTRPRSGRREDEAVRDYLFVGICLVLAATAGRFMASRTGNVDRVVDAHCIDGQPSVDA